MGGTKTVLVSLSNEQLDIIEKSLNFLKANIEQFNDMQSDWMMPTVSPKAIEQLLREHF